MLDYVKDWYLVKHNQTGETILSNFVHRDAIDSLLKILQHDAEGTTVIVKDEMYRVISISFEPDVEIEEFDL